MLRMLSLTAAAALVLTGCAGSFPADPDGTLDRVRGDVLRAGVTDNPPWTVLDGDAPPGGLEAELVTAFADGLDADVEWTTGNEESLVGALERGELDLVVGGLTAASPWADQAALTTAYTTVTGPEGEPEGHVMAVPLGENGFQVELESFLLERKDVQP